MIRVHRKLTECLYIAENALKSKHEELEADLAAMKDLCKNLEGRLAKTEAENKVHSRSCSCVTRILNRQPGDLSIAILLCFHH